MSISDLAQLSETELGVLVRQQTKSGHADAAVDLILDWLEATANGLLPETWPEDMDEIEDAEVEGEFSKKLSARLNSEFGKGWKRDESSDA